MTSLCPTRTTLLLLAALAATPWSARAGQPLPEPRVYQPPTFQYGEGRISLLESIRLTLANDPKLLAKGADARLSEGIFQELRGAFDWVLKGELTYDYREQELVDSTKKAEQDKRINAIQNEEDTCAERDRQRQILQQLIEERDGSDDDLVAPPDLSLDKQLQFFDILIAQASDPAQRDSLLSQKINFIETEIAARESVVVNLERACTQSGIDRQRMGEAPEFENFTQAKVDLKATKKFRSGVVLTPFLNGSYDSTQFNGKRNGPEEQIFILERQPDGSFVDVPLETSLGPVTRTIDFGGKGTKDIYQAAVGFELNIPMLRGRGADAVAARERAAERDFEAAGLAVKHAAAEAALRTATAYWSLLAAQDRVTILGRSVELEGSLVDMTQALIDGDEMPRAELPRALAGQANARSQLEAARRDLVKARMELAIAMGVGVESEANAPLAEGPFPEVPTAEAVAALDGTGLALGAVDRRFDHRSAQVAIEARRIDARGALLDQKGKLDLGLNLSSRAIGEDSLSNATDEWASPSYRVRVQGEKPFGNNERAGRYAQSLAKLDQQAIQSGDLDRNIKLNVVLSLRTLEQAVARYRDAVEAARLFRETVDAELEKLRLGSSTLIDAIQTEQQLTQAELSVVAALQEVASLLTRLRFETGTLLEDTAQGFEFDEPRLTALPEGAPPAGGAL
jgi:outer membrane protein TolC